MGASRTDLGFGRRALRTEDLLRVAKNRKKVEVTSNRYAQEEHPNYGLANHFPISLSGLGVIIEPVPKFRKSHKVNLLVVKHSFFRHG